MNRIALVLLVAAVACKGDERSPVADKGSGTGTGTATRAKGEPREDPRKVAEEEVRAFLERWTETQKKLDFAAYLALYEPRTFRGVKRTAKGKVSEFDFAGWKRDRQRMFGKKFEIATEPLEVETWLDEGSTLKGGISVVRFTQRWKSGKYADHGVKVLHVWHQKPGALFIVYEDLLNSEPGWDRVAENVPVAALAPPADHQAALALWTKLAPTGADYHQKLASIPADPAVRAPMARALLTAGNFACDKTVEYQECGEERLEWADLDLKSTLGDPCLRRRLALWALPELAPADMPALADPLLAMIEMQEPESELQLAALQALERGPELLRLRASKAAMTKDMEEKISVDGLSEEGLIIAAREIGIDAAALALDRSAHLEVIARLVNADHSMSEETRGTLLDALAEVKHPVATEALRKRAASDADCQLAMNAALALEQRGDGSYIPRRWVQGEEEDARSALCLSMYDSDDGRARALLASFVGPEGVTVTRVHKSEWDHLEREDAGPDDRSEPDAGPEAVTSLDEIAELVRETIEFDNSDPAWEKREVSFTKAKDGGLRLESFDLYRFNGCGC